MDLFFGLGEADRIDSLEIRWPREVSRAVDLEVDRVQEFRAGRRFPGAVIVQNPRGARWASPSCPVALRAPKECPGSVGIRLVLRLQLPDRHWISSFLPEAARCSSCFLRSGIMAPHAPSASGLALLTSIHFGASRATAQCVDYKQFQDQRVNLAGHRTFRIETAANFAYVASGSTGVLVADISDPRVLQPIRFVDTGFYAYDIEIQGDLMYVADLFGLTILDLSGPSAPAIISSLRTDGVANLFSVEVSNGFAYVGGAGTFGRRRRVGPGESRRSWAGPDRILAH